MDYRIRIKDNFKELAAARGLSRVTMDDLASHTGISKRTVYRYFRSKEEIIEAMLADFLATVEKNVEKELSSKNNPIEKISGVIRTILEHLRLIQPMVLFDLQKYYPHLWEHVERFRAEKIMGAFKTVMSDNGQGYFREVNYIISMTVLMASVRAVVNPAFILENNLTFEEAVQTVFGIFMHGIVAHGND